MTRAFFVSDIHISSPEDTKCLLFERFLDECLKRSATHVFLVGDIFDFWIADRKYLIKDYARVIEKIRALTAAGIRVHYFEGNHDLDLRCYWQHHLNVDVQSEATFYELEGGVVRVEHGDQMDPDDQGYLFLRWLLRTPLFVALGRYLPECIVRFLGRRASLASRDYTTQIKVTSDQGALEKIRRHARRVHKLKPFDLFVSGHVHVVEDSDQQVDGAHFRCINLGTWLKTPLVLAMEGTSLRLIPTHDFIQGK